MSRGRTQLLLFLQHGLALAAAAAVSAISGRAGLPVIWSSLAVFVSIKLSSDLFGQLFRIGGETFFIVDFLQELVIYIFLGLVAAGAIVLARNLLGDAVSPLVPAVVAYLLQHTMHK